MKSLLISLLVILGSVNALAGNSRVECSARCGFSYVYVPMVIMGAGDGESYESIEIDSSGPTVRDAYKRLISQCRSIGNNYNQTNNTSRTFQLFYIRNGSHVELDNSSSSMRRVCL